MNDRHPAGDPYPAEPGAAYAYADYDTAHYEQSAYGSHGTTGYATGEEGWPQDGYGVPGHQAYGTDPYGTGGYGDGGQYVPAYGQADAYGTGHYTASDWQADGTYGQGTAFVPQQPGIAPDGGDWAGAGPTADATAQWDVNAYDTAGWDGTAYGQEHDRPAEEFGGQHYPSQGDGPDAWGTDVQGTSLHPSDPAGVDEYDVYGAYASQDGALPAQEDAYGHSVYPADPYAVPDPYAADAYDPYAADPYAPQPEDGTPDAAEDAPHEAGAAVPVSEAEPEPGAAASQLHPRGRRRSPKAHRSALLTVAAPSVAVLGVAGIAAASVLPAQDEEPAQAASSPEDTEVQASPANTKLDTQLAGLREAGSDFADRASRTQERIDLKKRQEAERRREAAEAARREALRQKFFLPAEGFGISAYFGQAGINWMSVHTGIDFPVSYGTPIKAATDGSIRTQWNSAYGNMLILTAPDGTETWYCHLASTSYTSGSVQAGTVIGYSGSSGNSTGPHLHFEVHPGGGDAVDPLAWFRSHGLEPG
ncbi:M23 family metallopeptidase [Streptomyces sp. TR06-5]|uniref:M23 family metallopeptidase n=1 Tax=Streptomyces sp. TR06-5 TaxID=3385976 RepID=UPI00399FF0DD